MKRLFAAIILIIFLTSLCVAATLIVSNSYRSFQQELSECVTALKQKDYDVAKEKSAALANVWQEKRGMLSAFINHQTVEEVDETVAQLSSFANKENEAHFLAECEVLKLKFIEMKEYCGVSLHTLF
ncbi:MAG: DUF4363 family protein [Acutalibacteraceae bacterium]|nr:DUF4363 family protein [Acutalibacteraceae bacterium]